MTTGICEIDRIVIAIAIQVQAIDGFGVEVGGIVGADEAAPFGGVVPGVAIIQSGIAVVVIATVPDRIGVGNIVAGGLAGDGAVVPGVVQILGLQRAVFVVDGNHIALQVPLKVVGAGHATGGQFHANDAATDILPLCRPTVKKKPPRLQTWEADGFVHIRCSFYLFRIYRLDMSNFIIIQNYDFLNLAIICNKHIFMFSHRW